MEPLFVVCMLADDLVLMVRGTKAGECLRCGVKILIAPSSARALATAPEGSGAICEGCLDEKKDGPEVEPLSGAEEELQMGFVPNLWKGRN